ALSSKYKNEFLANMSHELRTPLNSLLILSKLLTENKDKNLSDKQVEFAQTIHSSGTDLLNLINDILDLSKVEAGKMEISPSDLPIEEIKGFVERTFKPVADQKGLSLASTSRPTCRRRSTPTASGCSRSSRTCSRTRSSSRRRAASRCRFV